MRLEGSRWVVVVLSRGLDRVTVFVEQECLMGRNDVVDVGEPREGSG